MQIDKISKYKGGWLVGNFKPSLFIRNDIEVGVHHIKKGYLSDGHFHINSNEYNLLIKGSVLNTITKVIYNEGEIIIFEPKDRSNLEFLEDTIILVIRDASDPKDKFF